MEDLGIARKRRVRRDAARLSKDPVVTGAVRVTSELHPLDLRPDKVGPHVMFWIDIRIRCLCEWVGWGGWVAVDKGHVGQTRPCCFLLFLANMTHPALSGFFVIYVEPDVRCEWVG